ncbi:MAG TPA: hypothetical protein VK066_12915 [Chloroflexota bacterium]|nr:hypothetical protein [Chloroflexota bacterium]
MAQVAPRVRRHIDLLLALAIDRWAGLPEDERTIDEWDPVDQSLFGAEWPLEEQRLDMLKRYVADGALTPAQLERYHELERLVAQNRPIVDRLLPGWVSAAESRRRQGLAP